MSEPEHFFSPQQADYLRAVARGQTPAPQRGGPASVSLVAGLPPVLHQGLQGTCVASAVVSLLEYYADCRTRLSVQFLYAATKEVERTGLERNLAAVQAGAPLDEGFETFFHAELLQLRTLADLNGGLAAPTMRPYLTRFAEGARARFHALNGSLLMSCLWTVETVGVCRYALWPSSAAPSTPVFGAPSTQTEFPPGTREDAAKRRVTAGVYLLRPANNVDEIRGILAGANNRRPMPVAVTVDFFAGCDGPTYSFPQTRAGADGRLAAVERWQGRHAVLLVGYRDDAAFPGGGYFILRNSLGEEWGDHGYGKLPYAYLECFACEAGTILQDRVDYEGDGYAGRRRGAGVCPRHRWPLALRLAANLALGALLVGLTAWYLGRRPDRGTDPGRMGTDPGRMGTDPRQMGTGPGRMGTDPGEMGTDPGRVGTDPRRMGTDPGQVGTVYKVFLSCADAAERKALRGALASEGVPYAVEFLPQTLETVLAVRVTMPEGDAYGAVAEILKAYYAGPRREFWTDVAGLSRSRAIYIVKAAVRQWEDVQ